MEESRGEDGYTIIKLKINETFMADLLKQRPLGRLWFYHHQYICRRRPYQYQHLSTFYFLQCTMYFPITNIYYIFFIMYHIKKECKRTFWNYSIIGFLRTSLCLLIGEILNCFGFYYILFQNTTEYYTTTTQHSK